MFKKKKGIVKLATLLMTAAPLVALSSGWGSLLWVGEPQLPKRILKEDVTSS